MDHEAFIEALRAQVDFGTAPAEKTAGAVLATLGEVLTPDEAEPFVAQIPATLARWLRPDEAPRTMTPAELYARVAQRTGLPVARALEVTQVVCRMLGAELTVDARTRLVAHLGPALGSLFETPHDAGRPERASLSVPEPLPGQGHTLATGRPGSQHPLSEAHPDTAHSESVARSDNPHADSKLSSAHGLTQEALHESLADGKPGPKRTVADTKD